MERPEVERPEVERLEVERLEVERLEVERLEVERLEVERLEVGAERRAAIPSPARTAAAQDRHANLTTRSPVASVAQHVWPVTIRKRTNVA